MHSIMRHPHKKIFIASVFITAVLAIYDITFDSNNHLTILRKAGEVAVYGIVYVLLTFAIASSLYFCISKLVQMIRKKIS